MSSVNDMAPGTSYQSVIDDSSGNLLKNKFFINFFIAPKSVEKVIFTCGRHYFTLLDERKKRGMNDKVRFLINYLEVFRRHLDF